MENGSRRAQQLSSHNPTNKNKPDICLASGLCYSQETGHEGFICSSGCTDCIGKGKEYPHFCPGRLFSPTLMGALSTWGAEGLMKGSWWDRGR